jgi:hypothetical protein
MGLGLGIGVFFFDWFVVCFGGALVALSW